MLCNMDLLLGFVGRIRKYHIITTQMKATEKYCPFFHCFLLMWRVYNNNNNNNNKIVLLTIILFGI